jgi:hypothetical protein
LTRRLDPVAVALFLLGVALLLVVSRLDFRNSAANWDLLNYHAYTPAALLSGTWFSDIHPANIQSFLAPYQDLMWWPLISGAPAPVATAVIVAIEISIFIPAGLILRSLVPALSLARSMGLGLVGISGAMLASELGTTNGDPLPAILISWAVYLLLSILSDRALRAGRRACLAGILAGAAVVLKFSVAFVCPGFLVFVAALLLSGRRRSALLFPVAAVVTTIVLYAPWALVLQNQAGSPMFPFYNAIFHAPRSPLVNIQDARFPVTSVSALAGLPIGQALGTSATSEIPIRDPRWALAFLAIGLGLVAIAIRARSSLARSSWRVHLPAVTLFGFWALSYATWAFVFGIQRYAMILEVLAVPIVVVGTYMVLPNLPNRTALLMLLVLVVFLGATTRIAPAGRRPMAWAPLFPTQTIEPTSRYEAIVIGSDPLAYIRAVTRDAPGASKQVWIGRPFNDADRVVAVSALTGRSIGVLFYPNARAAAEATAASLGLRITADCQTFDNPLGSDFISRSAEICTAVPAT